MCKKLVSILFILIPFFGIAQNEIPDSVYQKIIKTDCDGKVFTRVETLPALKDGTAAYADSITNYLKTKNVSFSNVKVAFRFLVTSKSQLLNMGKEPGIVLNEAVLREALENFSALWIPAKQNDRIVCAYVRCELEFIDNKLTVRLSQ